jgi:hypothetical protein
LRIQGFCNHSNPELTSITRHYKTITHHIYKILNKNNENNENNKNNENSENSEKTKLSKLSELSEEILIKI